MGAIQKQFELIISGKDDASKKIKEVSDNLEKAAKKIEGINSKLKILTGGFVFDKLMEVTAKFEEMFKPFIDAADNLNDLSDRTGIAADKLQVLVEVAKFGDVSVETLSKTLFKLSVAISETPDHFKAMGIEIADSTGKAKSTDEVFASMADRIKSIKDPSKQAAVAFQLFGKQAEELMPMLKMGGEQIRQTAKDIQDFGFANIDVLKAQSAAFNDAMQTIDEIKSGAKNKLLESVLPSVNVLLQTFIEFKRESALLAKSNKDTADSFGDFAESDGMLLLIHSIGVIGDAFNVLKMVVTGVYEGIKYVLKEIFNTVFMVSDMLLGLVTGDLDRVDAAMKASNQQTKENLKVFTDSVGKAYDKVEQQSFSTSLKKSFAGATEIVKDKVKSIASEVDKVNDIINAASKKTANAIGSQLKNINYLTEEAVNKSKQAASQQKSVADEFEALAKRLNKQLPSGGTLQQKLEQAKRDASADSKQQELRDKKLIESKEKGSQSSLDKIKEEVDAKQKAYDSDQSAFNASILKDAQKKLASEQSYQNDVSFRKDINKIDDERYKKELSVNEQLNIRSAVSSEISSIQKEIAKNTDKGYTSEAEIKRLQEVGKVLEDNKNSASGVFSASDFASYADQLKELSATATQSDSELLKAKAESMLAEQQKVLEALQAELNNIDIQFSDKSVTEQVDKLRKALEEGVKNSKLTVDVVGNLIMGNDAPGAFVKKKDEGLPQEASIEWVKKAEGGLILGPGTSKSDSIPAMLSNKEYVVPADTVAQPGVYSMLEALRRGGDFSSLRKPNHFADGGLVGMNTINTNNNNITIDLRANNGNMNIDNTTTQADANKFMRAALRR